jgi:hypothetical protein
MTLSSQGPIAAAMQWSQICAQSEKARRAWIDELRSQGFKAAHPHDGWVNQDSRTVQLVYPQFNDGAGLGDLIMLGCHYISGGSPVRLISYSELPLSQTLLWGFEDLIP